MLISVLAKKPYPSGVEGKTWKMVSRKQSSQAPHMPKRAWWKRARHVCRILKNEPMLRWTATYREEFEERILENLPLFILVGNHWDVDFAEILREQEDETDGSEENTRIRGHHHLQGWHHDPTLPFRVICWISKGLCLVSF